MSAIGIVDYGMGNLGSVSNACRFLGLDAVIVTGPERLDECRSLILPGVGAFGDCMAQLTACGFVDPLREWIASGRPFLGICLGLQVLFEGSEESPGVSGLGVFKGTVKRFQFEEGPASRPDAQLMKVPQIGWNAVRQSKPHCPLFEGIADGEYFYFVHSYYVAPEDPRVAAGMTGYGLEYCSAVWHDQVFAVQFHPEKSQSAGLRMLRNFGGG